MKNFTRKAFNAYLDQQAVLNGLDSGRDVISTFSVEPSVQQKLETKIQESSDFLKKINIVGVDEMEGEKLGLGVSGPIASRIDTTENERTPRDVHTLDSKRYRCEQTNYDVFIRYITLNMWAKFPEFQIKLRDAITKRMALDRIMIGFNGVSVAKDTNLGTNQMLQDVNIGWLEHIRQQAPQRNMKESDTGTGKVVVNPAGNGYKNLDALVQDCVSNLLDPWFVDDTGLVVITGRKLIEDKYFKITNNADKATEILAASLLPAQKLIGGLPAYRVPYFPDNAMLITRFDNLSIYYQNGAMRKSVQDNPKRDRIETYQSSNDAYVVEDFGCAALIENITLEG